MSPIDHVSASSGSQVIVYPVIRSESEALLRNTEWQTILTILKPFLADNTPSEITSDTDLSLANRFIEDYKITLPFQAAVREICKAHINEKQVEAAGITLTAIADIDDF